MKNYEITFKLDDDVTVVKTVKAQNMEAAVDHVVDKAKSLLNNSRQNITEFNIGLGDGRQVITFRERGEKK